jgi:hypothetical protein
VGRVIEPRKVNRREADAVVLAEGYLVPEKERQAPGRLAGV